MAVPSIGYLTNNNLTGLHMPSGCLWLKDGVKLFKNYTCSVISAICIVSHMFFKFVKVSPHMS